MSEKKKVAIVLRGPPATGKTSIKNYLFSRLGLQDDSFVNLDQDSSAISQSSGFDVLILELAYGEGPSPFSPTNPPGKTRNPRPWIDLLRSQKREIFGFLLYADWSKARERIEKKWHGDPEAQNHWTLQEYIDNQQPYHEFYQTAGCQAFASTAGITEHTLDFDKSAQELADHIINLCGLGGAKPLSVIKHSLAGYLVAAVLGALVVAVSSLRAHNYHEQSAFQVLACMGAGGALVGFEIAAWRRKGFGGGGMSEEWKKFYGSAWFYVLAAAILGGSAFITFLGTLIAIATTGPPASK